MAGIALPFQKAANYTHDNVWVLDSEEQECLKPATTEVVKWLVWKFNLSSQVSHPLVAFGVALGGLGAMKYGMYQLNKNQKNESPRNDPSQSVRQSERNSSPSPIRDAATIRPENPIQMVRRPPRPQREPAAANSPRATHVARSMETGRTEELEDEFFSSENPTPESLISSPNGFVFAQGE
jgi:hypothetical protein